MNLDRRPCKNVLMVGVRTATSAPLNLDLEPGNVFTLQSVVLDMIVLESSPDPLGGVQTR